MDKAHFLSEFRRLETDELLSRRALADGLVPEAHQAIEEELDRRGVKPPPIPHSAIRDTAINPSPSSGSTRVAATLLLVAGLIVGNGLVAVLKANPALHLIASLVLIGAFGIYFARSKAEESSEAKKQRQREQAKSKVGYEGYSELMFAASDGDFARVGELMAYGANVNQQDASGGSALMYAALNGNKEIVELLLSSGADSGLKSKIGMDAAAYAAKGGFPELASRLANAGRSPAKVSPEVH